MNILGYDITLKNIKEYVKGNVRYLIDEYGNDFINLEEHIKEQVVYRKSIADKQCVQDGVCKCNCTIPELFYADKSCNDKCYPEMMNKTMWNNYKTNMELNIKGDELGNLKLNQITEHTLSFDCIYLTKSIQSVKVSCSCVKITNLKELLNKQFSKNEQVNIEYTIDTNRKRLGDNNIILTVNTIIYDDTTKLKSRELIYDIIIKSKIII